MKWASVPSAYRNCILRASVRTARNFSPARNVRSMTAPSDARRSFERTNAPPLPGLTCWNSTILKIVPSTSMWLPFLNWLVLIMGVSGQGTSRVGADRLRLLTPSRVADMWAVSDLAASPSAPARPLPLRLLGDDERLARLAAGGSERAFAVLYERHHQSLYRYARTIVRNDEDARDVLQTTMARALTALGRHGVPDAPIRPWLFRIAHNEAVSVLRRRRRTIELDAGAEPEAPSLEARVEERARLTTLVADLQDLPVRQRSALVMRELSGLSHEEIAGALEISLSAAKQAIFDARTGLHDFAKGRAMQCADVQRIVSERDGRMLRGRQVRAHLRSCAACRAMRDAIGARRADLAALAPPLPAAAATGLLSGVLGGGGTGGLATKVAAGAFAAKALAGAAVVATVAVGTVEVAPRVDGARDGDAGPSAPAAPAARARAASPVVAAGAAAPRPAGGGRGARPAAAGPGAPRPPPAPPPPPPPG